MTNTILNLEEIKKISEEASLEESIGWLAQIILIGNVARNGLA